MSKYVIERELPGAGLLSPSQLQAISQKSVETLDGMAGRAQWVQSYVTDDKLFCVYIADDVEAVREHARTPCSWPSNWGKCCQQAAFYVEPITLTSYDYKYWEAI